MDQLKRLISNLSRKQLVTIGATALGVLLGVYWLAHWNRERDFKPLYTGLAQEDGAAVLAKIRENGSEFRLAENGSTVLVPSARVNELRLQLAAAGIPKSGRIGYELFDKTNFGVSDFAEQVNFHRALEGELERSISGLIEVEQARVHLTFPKESVFLDSRQPAKASVLLKLKPGGKLLPQNVTAIAHLTASAVDGLAPEAVSILDMRGNLLSRPHHASLDGAEPSDAALEYRQRIEKDLLAKVNSTLEPVLGAERYRASIAVDCDFTSGEQSEETFDPGKSVMVTSQKTEDVSGGAAASGVPGTGSNLPRPVSRPGGGANGTTRRTESVSYQSSRLVRKLRLPQGNLKRISASVLLDHTPRWEGTGAKAKRVLDPPSLEKIKVIHDLVAGVIGVSTERGDQVLVETLPFESTLNPELPTNSQPVAAPGSGLPKWLVGLQQNRTMQIVAGGAAVAVLVLLALVTFLIRKRGKRKRVEMAKGVSGRTGEAAALPDAGSGDNQLSAKLAAQSALQAKQDAEALLALKIPPITTKKAEVLAKHLTQEAKNDPIVIAQLLRTWLREQED